jgi:hypothetical protein
MEIGNPRPAGQNATSILISNDMLESWFVKPKVAIGVRN